MKQQKKSHRQKENQTRNASQYGFVYLHLDLEPKLPLSKQVMINQFYLFTHYAKVLLNE